MTEFSQLTIATSSTHPGFRFSPTDADLISHYLQKKMEGAESCVELIAEVDICNYEPWELPAKSVIPSNSEWLFFSARGRKYPKGSQSRRATDRGYWKATGKERNVMSADSVLLGTKRTLVFHIGRAPRGQRTEWIIHEYCMSAKPPDSMVVCRLKRKNEFRPNHNASKQGSPTQQPSTSNNNNFGTSDGDGGGGTDHNSISTPEKLVESYLQSGATGTGTGTDQTYYSYFPEHIIDSEYGNGDGESFGLQKDLEAEEELFAQILNDDIINLDEDVLSTKLESEIKYEETIQQPVMAHMQGTANRRLKLKSSNLKISDPEASQRSKDSPNCILTLLSGSKGVNWSVVFLVLCLVVLSCVFYGMV